MVFTASQERVLKDMRAAHEAILAMQSPREECLLPPDKIKRIPGMEKVLLSSKEQPQA